MTTVFIGGSRSISRISEKVQQRLERIIAGKLPVIVGDANGTDKAVQKYLSDKSYRNVEIFCSGETARNNVGDWPLRKVSSNGIKNFDFYAAKDRVMTHEATVGFMIWDGRSVGTLLNVKRLLGSHKKVVVYEAPTDRFWELKSVADWQSFASGHSPSLRNRLAQKARLEEPEGSLQATLLT
jgi:hypothetical protein